MTTQHRMTLQADTGSEKLFVCEESACGRRFVLQRSGGLVVLERGDFFALHSGGTGGLSVSADLPPDQALSA